MAWSRLQSASNTAGSGNVSATLGTNLTSGSKIICAVSVSASTGGAGNDDLTSVTDTASNALTKLVALFHTSGAAWLYLLAMDTPAGDVGGTTTLTANWNSGAAANFGITILAQEVSGLLTGNTSAMLDGTPATNNATSTGPATTGSYSSTASNEYLVAVYGDPGYGVTVTNSAGYTADANNVNASSSATLMFDYKNSGNTAESASFTLSGSADWATILAAFQLGGNIPGPPLTDAPVPVNMPVIVTGRAGWRNAGHSR